jgi:VWFA-related protein
MTRRVAEFAACALIAGSVLTAQVPSQTTPSSQLPTFRTSVDVVELDVTVLDKDRHPVKGLTAADFTVLERGKPQLIVAFNSIDVPAPTQVSAPWMRDAPLDVVSNAESRRLVTIVMDDAYTKLEPDVMKRAKQIARNAVEQLGPSDLASVVFTFLGRAQNFTADRTQLLAAIDSYTPKTIRSEPPVVCLPVHRSCDVETLATVASTLLTASPGRKVVILISGGRGFTFGEMGNPSSRNEASELEEMFTNLQRANATVYAFDAHGLEVEHGPNPSLYSFAESTGGRAFVNTNDPASYVGGAFLESSTYYLVGFQSSDPGTDGGFRKIEVKVNRPGFEVRTRSGYYAPKKAASRPAGAVINGLPSGDLPVHATAAPFAVRGRREAEVIIMARMEPLNATPDLTKVALAATAIDTDSKSYGTQRQTMEVTSTPGSRIHPDLPSHLPLPPGRYMVRLAAESEGRTGTVFVDVEVPDFAKSPLPLSGLVLQRGSAARVADKVIASLIPVAPTAGREFSTADEVTVFLRVYQGGKGRVAPVRMLAKVTNERNNVTSNQEAVIEVDEFGETRAADYRVALPVAHLSPGAYLLEVDARSGTRRVLRSARFTIVKDR